MNHNRNRNREKRSRCVPAEDKDEGFRASLENIGRTVFGSCGNVMEAASFLVQSSWYHKNKSAGSDRKTTRPTDPLSTFAGRYQSKSLNPKEEEGGASHLLRGQVCSVEEQTAFDDNISALSAFTLEEMANRLMISTPSKCGEITSETDPPSPVRTNSSSSSSREQVRYRFMESGRPHGKRKGLKKTTEKMHR